VLVVRAAAPQRDGERLFDAALCEGRILHGGQIEHVLIQRGNHRFRLDVIEGALAASPVSLRFELADDERLAVQLAEIGRFRSASAPRSGRQRLAQKLSALHAFDASAAGASLREIADLVLGFGAWPGVGEHRKSLVRRLVATGDRMVRTGPSAVLIDPRQCAWQIPPI